jgi:hypothetical protein
LSKANRGRRRREKGDHVLSLCVLKHAHHLLVQVLLKALLLAGQEREALGALCWFVGVSE